MKKSGENDHIKHDQVNLICSNQEVVFSNQSGGARSTHEGNANQDRLLNTLVKVKCIITFVY